jgi:hypothetical protein
VTVTTTWYVQTRGYHHDHGYSWLQVDSQAPIASPDLLLAGCAGFSVNDIADEVDPTLLLFAQPSAPGTSGAPVWTLLANGLHGTPERGDHSSRPIRASVLAYARGPVPASDMIDFACAFLVDAIPALPIDYRVNRPPGFSLSSVGWEDLLAGIPRRPEPGPKLPGSRSCWHAPDRPESRERAAGILRRLRTTPADTPWLPDSVGGSNPRPLLVASTTARRQEMERLRSYLFLGPDVTTEDEVAMNRWRGDDVVRRLRQSKIMIFGLLVGGVTLYAAFRGFGR